MASDIPLDEVKLRGAATPATEELRALYRAAFAEYGPVALWSSRPVQEPTVADLLAITESLRVEGNLAARRLAERIESARAVPLSDLQTRLLRALAERRSPESYVAGASPLARAGTRYSADIDVFHDREEAVQTAALADTATLEAAGFRIEWVRRQPTLFVAVVHGADDATRLEWAVDSDFRFFPAIPDELFGYVLHLADIATNKALAASGRREPRDVVDLLWLDEHYLPLGPVVWAAVGKDPGFTPEGLLAEICRTTRYQQADFDRLRTEQPISAAEVSRQLRAALRTADAFVRAMPSGAEGRLFLRQGRPVQPDPADLESCAAHAGARHGHWPSSPDITNAMLERYGRSSAQPGDAE